MFQRSLLLGIFCLLLAGRAISQVNLQTGSATFSLPIFNWQDDKSRLNSFIALSYNSGNGLRVSDLPSNVGQGWNLIAGGQIVRIQVGEPDDQWPKDGNEWDITKYPAGILYATVPAYNGCPTALTKYPIYGWKNQIYKQHNVLAEDKQLDYFSFQFNGKAGMFVVDPTNIGTCQSLGDTKIKINFQQDANLINQGIRTRITSFSIQDVDGLIYKFAQHGLTKLLKSEYCDKNQVQLQKQPKFTNDKVYHQAGFDNGQIVNPWVIGSWYLTEIEDALTHRKITFNYTIRNINNSAGDDIIYNSEKDYSIIFHKKSITQTPEVTSINFPDGHLATLNYGANRLDLSGDYVLSSIDISYLSRYLSRHELSSSYFILNRYGTPISEYQKRMSRLCLLSVKKIGHDMLEDSPPYKFDYYTGSNTPDDIVPPPFTHSKDIWGFYNGDQSMGYWNEAIYPTENISDLSNNKLKGLVYLRNGTTGSVLNPKSGYSRNGLLKQIIYPTGGTLTYNYLQNTGVLGGATRDVGGVHVSQTSSTDGGYSNGCGNPLITQYNYVMNGPGSNSSLWGLEMPVNSRISYNHYQPEWKSYKWSLNCIPFGCCYYHFQYPGIESMQQATDLSGFQKAMATLSPVLGIISLISTIQDIITAFGGTPGALIIDVILGIVQVAITCIGNQARDNTATLTFSSNLNDAAPLPTQFKRVEVTESSGGIGKTVQEFTSDDDYPIWVVSNPNYASKQRFAPWAYGLPKKATVLDASGNLIKQTENIYDFTYAMDMLNYCSPSHGLPCNTSGLTTNLVSCKCEVDKSYSQRNTNWSDPNQYNNSYQLNSNNDLKVDFYGMFTGRTKLTSSKERTFKPGSNTEYLESSTNYTYNPINYEPETINTTDFTGETKYKWITYSCDYSVNSGILLTLNQNNIIAAPVATSTYIFTNKFAPYGWQRFYLNEEVTEYAVMGSGDIKPYRSLEQRFDKPLPYYNPGGPAFSGYAGPGSSSNPPYKETQTFTYDGAGILIGVKDEGNRNIANIYDYNDKYITASVINADPVADYPVYTSFETASFGGWSLINSGVLNTTTAMTGVLSYNLTAGKFGSNPTKFRATLNIGKPYIVSFWSSTILTVSGGATLTKSAPTINGFTYYEYDVPQGTSIVDVSGSTGTIDELRCYPKSARMRTVTYDPIVGKTSECDENNRITYFEYDNLGRLRFIKDEKKNVVKMYEYNNVSAAKQNGCPGIYYNKLISEKFKKDNCGTGYLGGEVTYTVAANTYSSLLSQADADAQADAFLLANGQTFANANGTCTLLFYNTPQSQNFITESCGLGYVGGTVTYTVPAGRYWSTVSQADANQMALDEIDANGDNYANTAPNSVCLPDANPVWIWLEGASWYCMVVNGSSHLFVFETDINPNSNSYLSTRWSDTGPSDLCAAGTYWNVAQSANFTRNNCLTGYTGSTVTYTVPAGTYSSTISQANADQLAINDVNANGQAYANVHGTCTPAGGCPPYCENTPQFKCINDNCEQGFRVNTNSYPDQGNYPFWICVFHYEFSDGSWSIDLYESNPDPCYSN